MLIVLQRLHYADLRSDGVTMMFDSDTHFDGVLLHVLLTL